MKKVWKKRSTHTGAAREGSPSAERHPRKADAEGSFGTGELNPGKKVGCPGLSPLTDERDI